MGVTGRRLWIHQPGASFNPTTADPATSQSTIHLQPQANAQADFSKAELTARDRNSSLFSFSFFAEQTKKPFSSNNDLARSVC